MLTMELATAMRVLQHLRRCIGRHAAASTSLSEAPHIPLPFSAVMRLGRSVSAARAATSSAVEVAC